MDPSSLIPNIETIPVHWGWFKFLLILTFVLHLILMNLMLGGSLLALFRRVRGESTPSEAHGLPTLIALTVNLGVPPLLFMQVLFGQFFYSSSVLMAVAWISVVPILILAYYAAYGFLRQDKPGFNGTLGTLWLSISALFLLFIGFMLSNNMTLMLRPERWDVYFTQPGGTFLNVTEPTLIPRFLHFVTASIAVAGLGRAVFHILNERRGGTPRPDEVASGLKIFAFATIVQVVIGIIFWFTLPGAIGKLFFGGSLVHTIHIAVAILFALSTILFAFRRRIWLTTGHLFGTIVMMVLVRDMVRTAYLEPYFHPRDLPVVQQLSPLILFFVSLIIVAALIWYMVRHAWQAKA
jgi:hypothetical protein